MMKSRVCVCLGLLLILIAPLARGEDGIWYARVTADGLRVRSDWNLDAVVLTGLKTGEVVPVLGRSDSTQLIGEMQNYWYQVEAPGGVTGWAFGAFLDLYTRYETLGFAISVDDEIAEGLTIREVAAFTDGESGRSWPRHLHVVFDGYPGHRVSEFEREMRVFATDPNATGAATTILSGAPVRLRDLLAGPVGSQVNPTVVNLRGLIPIVPEPPGAHHAFVAAAQPLAFDGGNGIRFLTQIVQNLVWPPTQTITYVYQGYTNDDSAYVSAWFQVQRPAVAADSWPRPADARIWDGYEEYGRELDSQANEEFEPDLSQLDALIRSISISW